MTSYIKMKNETNEADLERGRVLLLQLSHKYILIKEKVIERNKKMEV